MTVRVAYKELPKITAKEIAKQSVLCSNMWYLIALLCDLILLLLHF